MIENSTPVCIDASFVVRALVDPANVAIQRVWQRVRAEHSHFVAPVLLRYEVTNALWRYERAGTLSSDEITEALRAVLALPVTLYADDSLHQEALAIARRLRLPATYDAHYLALAEILGVELWTADARLWNSVRHQLDWVHLAAGDQP